MHEKLYVVAFPRLTGPDAGLLSTLRARFYPAQAGRIGPHFTFVFSVPVGAYEPMVEHVRAVAAATPPISFVLRKVTPLAEPSSTRICLALVPEQGDAAMIDLHERLHHGPLERYREPALRFRPHLTMGMRDGADGSITDRIDCIERAIRDSGSPAGIAGQLVDLSVVAETTDAVMERTRVPLGGSLNQSRCPGEDPEPS